ncbi:MAG: hypothetical protein ACI4PO_11195 [Faecousia sp.]
MRKLTAMLLAAVMLISFGGCELIPGQRNADKDQYTYDDSGRIIKEVRYYFNDYTGQYLPSFTIEYTYDDAGLLTEKILYDEDRAERFAQRNEYTYNEMGKLQTVKLYDQEQTHFCTTTYAYYDTGEILSKEMHFEKLQIGYSTSTIGGVETEYCSYFIIYYDDQSGSQCYSKVFSDEAVQPDEDATYTVLTEYYKLGIEKKIAEYRSGQMISRTEYPENEQFRDTLLDENVIFLGGPGSPLCYQELGDGTYHTSGEAGTKQYLYDQNGNLTTYRACDLDGNYIITEYFESGAIKARTEVTYLEQGFQYESFYCEEYYESGAKKSVQQYDPQTDTMTTIQWDEEGNVIEQEQ